MSAILKTVISAAAALVTNLDRAPIEVPEFHAENVFETKHALYYFILQHYIKNALGGIYKVSISVIVW